jgi:hypothetical protein
VETDLILPTGKANEVFVFIERHLGIQKQLRVMNSYAKLRRFEAAFLKTRYNADNDEYVRRVKNNTARWEYEVHQAILEIEFQK